MNHQQYSCKICGYEVTLILGKDFFQMNYHQQTDPSRIYTVVLDKTFKTTTNASASRLVLQTFKNFAKFYQYLVNYAQDQRRVSISNAGYVTICYFSTVTLNKNTKVKKIEFDGRRLVSKSEMKEEKQLKSDVMDVRAENTFLCEALGKLTRKIEEESLMIANLRTKLLTRKYDYLNDLKADTKELTRHSMRKELYTTSKEANLNQLAFNIKALKMQIHGLIQNIAKKENSVPEMDDSIPPYPQNFTQDDLDRYGFQHWVVIDRNNRFIDGNFIIQEDTIHKIGLYGTFQILGRDPFPPTGKHFYSAFIQNISYSIFSLGIINQNRRNFKESHEVKGGGCIAYFALKGTIWNNGYEIGQGKKIPNGVEIRVVVDMDKQIIKWFMDGQEIGGAMIDQKTVKARLVPYILMNYPGNRITFNRKRDKNEGPKPTQPIT